MQVKRFVAENMRMALKMVREDVGLDAVILSNKRVDEGVEILIALDPEGHLTDPVRPAVTQLADNPFESKREASKPAPAQPATPSKLELELERLQRDARERAKFLAASLSAGRRSAQSPAPELQRSVEKPARSEQEPQRQVAEPQRLGEKPQSPAAELDQPAGAQPQGFKQLLQTVNESSLAEDVVKLTVGAGPSAAAVPISAASQAEGELAQMRSELQVMRDMMERQLSSMAWGQYTEKSPDQASFWRRLKRIGLDAGLCSRLLNEVSANTDHRVGWQQMMQQLSAVVPVAGPDLLAEGGVFTFVGPTGAGKTTTIGKLAAQYVLKNGSANIALVSTDTARIGAYEQLRTFARILDIPVKIVDAQHSLEKVLFGLRDKSLVLVDTSGYNRQDPRLAKQMNTINKLGRRLTSLLVLPTTSQGQVLKAAYHSYKTDNLRYCILSKLDESTSLGEAISLSVENGLPIAYCTDGQDVPGDIAPASSQLLVAKAIALAQQVELDEGAVVDDFATLSNARL